MNSLSWVEIHTPAVEHNCRAIRALLPGDCRLAAVLKSNAYGHGLTAMARFLQQQKLADYIAVANDAEALTLRQQGITLPIVIISCWHERNAQALVKNNIELAVYSFKQIECLKQAGNGHKTANIHLKIDTGAHRLGIAPAEVEQFVACITANPCLKLRGVFSHFAVADEDADVTQEQSGRFAAAVDFIQKQTAVPLVHIANSAGLTQKTARYGNTARVGIALYGLQPNRLNPQYADLKPALAWKTRIIQVSKVLAGERISYGLTYQFTKDALVATLPVGYADGYDRGFSNCADVLIRGQRFPVRGRVCMNLVMVEVDESVREGDDVVLIGKQGHEEITADELAEKIGTINYEIVARINPELERKYVE